MRKEVIYTLKNLYRADMNIYGYHFGKGEKSACIVGACRGNEIQQLYICSQLVRKLKQRYWPSICYQEIKGAGGAGSDRKK